MKNLVILLFTFSSFLALSAQNCVLYFPETEGTQLSYKDFDKNGKLSGYHKQRLTKIASTADQVLLEIESIVYDEKEEELHKGTMEVSCKNNTFYIDMEKYLDKSTLAGFEGMDIEVESENLELPSGMKPGDELRDSWVKASISNSGMKIMSFTVNIINRKVEAEENITTEAGTFKCLKISQTVETDAIMKMVIKSTEWYSEKIGLIKSESFSSNGKLMSSSVLVKISK